MGSRAGRSTSSSSATSSADDSGSCSLEKKDAGVRRPKGKACTPTRTRGHSASGCSSKKPDAHVKKGSIVDDEPRSVLVGAHRRRASRERRNRAASRAAGREDGRQAGYGRWSQDSSRCSPPPSKRPNSGQGWLFELKLDGFRIIADKRGEDAALFFRKQGSANGVFPEIVRAVRALAPSRAVLDGEVVAFDENGRPSFQKLLSRMTTAPPRRFDMTWAESPVMYIVFDLLALGPYDLRPLPLTHRKALLSELIKGKGAIRVLDHLPDDGRRLFEFCEREHLEGMVTKRADSPYISGPRRTGDWIKIKCDKDDEFVVIGFTVGEGGRARLGAVDLGAYSDGELVVRGKVGSGLDDHTIDVLARKAHAARSSTNHRPKVISRRPRVDASSPSPKWWSACTTEAGPTRAAYATRYFVAFATTRILPSARRALTLSPLFPMRQTRPPEMPVEPAAVAVRTRVNLTNPNKVFWPDDGFTKKDLCDYYVRMAPAILPYLQDRPVVLVRYPDGIAGKNFTNGMFPPGLRAG